MKLNHTNFKLKVRSSYQEGTHSSSRKKSKITWPDDSRRINNIKEEKDCRIVTTRIPVYLTVVYKNVSRSEVRLTLSQEEEKYFSVDTIIMWRLLVDVLRI